MRTSYILTTALLTLLPFTFILAQSKVSVSHRLQFEKDTFDVVLFRVDSSLFRSLSLYENRNKLSEQDLSDSLNSEGKFFAINASIVDSALMPIGLFINNAKKVKGMNMGKGAGNFYLGTNGFLGLSRDSIYIKESGLYDDSLQLIYAVQSGPMVIKENTMDTLFKKNSRNKNIRCGVGISKSNNELSLIFARSINEVSFYSFAHLLKQKYNCEDALVLESGPIVSFMLPTIKQSYRENVFVSNYILIRVSP